MPTHKLKISLDRDEILARLERLAEVALLRKAEEAFHARERDLAAAKSEHARFMRLVEEAPPRIRAGQAPASLLASLLRDRDAAALLLAPAEKAANEARARIVSATAAARAAKQQEAARLRRTLQRHADELAPVLEELAAIDRDIVAALGTGGERSVNPLCRVPGERLAWPCSPADAARLHRHRGPVAAKQWRNAVESRAAETNGKK
jgi:hypothetical protein